MALLISVPDAAYSTQVVSINVTNITLKMRWNTIADTWSMDVYVGDEPLRLGIAFKSNRNFTGKYVDLTERLGGFFFCQRVSDDVTTPLNYDSFTIGTHRLVFVPLA